MNKLQVHEIIAQVNRARTRAEKVEILKNHNDNWALKDIIRGSFDPDIQFNLPEGKPPFEKCDPHNAPSDLIRRHKDFRHFIKGGPGDKIMKVKRENIFIGILESIHPKDADLVIDMVSKSLDYGITRKIVDDAYPGLITGK